ncbi:MAG: STN domain-containing protein, partial [Planctomycetes bacterium]|nr:STN domain-containing protein [Planctomycetota bacterium]
PLKEAVRQLSQLTGVRFEFDQREIEQVLGFGPELPVSIDVTEVSLERVLRRILSRIELAWVIEDEYVLITTRGNWCQAATVTLYPADDLVSAKKGEDRSGRNLDELAELISTVVRPESWGEMGGPGATAPIEVAGANVIVIRQTRDAHEELAQFFALLRRAARQSAAEESFSAVCPSPEEEKFRRLLRRKVTLHVESEPLEAVARQLEKTTGVGMELDELEIKQVLNLDPDVPVSIDVTDVPLDRALDRMLMPLELTWVMAGEYILITSVEKADQMLTIRLYPVGDLVEPREHVRRADWDFDSLCNILTGSVCPHTWEEVGGPGTMMSTQLGGLNALAVRQTRKPHEETAATLAALREAVRQSAAGSLTPVQLAPEAHGEKKIRQQLRRKVTIDIQKEPLQEAIKKLRAVTDIDIVVDYAETRSVLGIDHDDPVSIASVDQPLGSALRRSLHPLDLTWIIEDERLVITTREKADQTLLYRLYPVRDLVSPGGIADPAGYDFESLTEAITTCIRPESWSEGKPYLPSVEIGGMAALLIEQTAEVHEEIAALLDKLRAAGEKKE